LPAEAAREQEERQPPPVWAEAPVEWPEEKERRDEEEGWPSTEEPEAQAAVEEWTAGMIRPELEAEEPEWEEEPPWNASEPLMKEPEEAEDEFKYGI